MTASPRPTSAAEITEAVIASFANCPDQRLREIMQSLIRHLHQFATETRICEGEWQTMIRTLTETGQITDERRQEFILWSDTLGLSMLVDALAHELPPGATESTVLGPFYVAGSPRREYGESMAEEERAGTPAWVHGRVLDIEGRADRRRRARRLAERRRSPLRGAASRGSRGPPPRPLPQPRRRDIRTARGSAGPLPDPGLTVRWERCSRPPAAIPGVPPTST